MASAEALTTDEAAAPVELRPRQSLLRRLRWPLMIGGPVLILAVVIYFLATAGRSQSTDDAYVQAARVPISASIGGRVIDLEVKENQPVQAGQVLFRLDVRDQAATLEQNQAQVASAKLRVDAYKAAYQQQLAGLKSAQDTAAFDDREVVRQKGLLDAGVASRDQYEAAEHAAPSHSICPSSASPQFWLHGSRRSTHPPRLSSRYAPLLISAPYCGLVAGVTRHASQLALEIEACW